MTFIGCLMQCLDTPELVREFDRLNGTHLGTVATRSPLDAAIDEATGRDKAALDQFAAFVYEFVWTRLPPDA
jgi:hypothetical protein